MVVWESPGAAKWANRLGTSRCTQSEAPWAGRPLAPWCPRARALYVGKYSTLKPRADSICRAAVMRASHG